MIFAANWKLNLSPSLSLDLLKELCSDVDEKLLGQIYIYPQNLALAACLGYGAKQDITVGAQNIYSELSGAYTGENSIEALKDLGGKSCLVGHSERRSIFGETDELLNKKMLLCQSESVLPILCIGESLSQRELGDANQVLEEQLALALKSIDESTPFMLAYEPVWAIGTGKVATPKMAEDAHQFVRNWLEKRYSASKASRTSILYGGSVKPDNAKALSEQFNIDGFLIGGASLKLESFRGIIDNSANNAGLQSS